MLVLGALLSEDALLVLHEELVQLSQSGLQLVLRIYHLRFLLELELFLQRLESLYLVEV